MSIENPFVGHTPQYRLIHAPTSIEILRDANIPTDVIVAFAATASGFDTATGLFDVGQIGPKRGGFYWPGDAVFGANVGAWFASPAFGQVQTISSGEDYTVGVKRAYGSGALVANTASGTVTTGQLFARGDLMLVIADEAHEKYGFPAQTVLVVDGAQLGSSAANYSTRMRRASSAGLEGTTASGFSPVERPLNDILGVFNAPAPDVGGGETEPSHLGGLVMFQTAGYTQRVRISDLTAGGYLADVLRYQHDDASIASGMAIRTDAEYWTSTQTVPPNAANKGGTLNFQTAAPTLASRQYASSFNTGAPAPPWKESQFIFQESFGFWHVLSPAVTVIASGVEGHVVEPSLGGNNRRWSDVLGFRDTSALAIKTTASLVNNSTGSGAILNSIITVSPDRALGALNLTSGMAYYAGFETGSAKFLRSLLRTGEYTNTSGSVMSGVAFNASGMVWASGGAFAPMGTRNQDFGKVFRGTLGGEALGFFAHSSEVGSESYNNASAALDAGAYLGIRTSGVFFRPVVPLPRQDPTVFSFTIDPDSVVGNAPVLVYASSTTWGTDHYKYWISDIDSVHSGTSPTVFLGSSGKYFGYVHNIGSTKSVLKTGDRVACWYNYEQEDWVCVVKDAMILVSPNGHRWEITIDDSGVLTQTDLDP